MSGRAKKLREWTCSNQVRVTLTYYPSEGRHSSHVHDHTQISFLICGEVRERLGVEYYLQSGVARAIKPWGLAHEDEWGSDGALFFTVHLHDPASAWQQFAVQPNWAAVRRPDVVSRLVRLFTSDLEFAHREELLHDLLSGEAALPGVEANLPSERADPPPWLKRGRDMIAEDPEQLLIHEVAHEAGVHRVQLSRMFQRFYGMPPSLFRQRTLVARAVALLGRSDASLSEVAAEAGFCDQAHLTRSLRRDTGLTPRHLRELFATATSVQSPGGAGC